MQPMIISVASGSTTRQRKPLRSRTAMNMLEGVPRIISMGVMSLMSVKKLITVENTSVFAKPVRPFTVYASTTAAAYIRNMVNTSPPRIQARYLSHRTGE